MAGFSAPFDPPGWTLATPGPLTVPPGLRYAGLRLLQLRATRSSPAPVRMPAPGVPRSATAVSGEIVVEVQVNPFPMRHVAQAVPFGLPTFYLVFDAGSALVAFADGDAAAEGELLATVATVSVLCTGQDRVARDPALWASLILEAIPAADRGPWQPFAGAVEAQTAGGAEPPVLVLDHRGAPLETGAVQIVAGPITPTAVLVEADGGDLQRAVARMHAANPGTMPLASVFAAGAGSVTLRPSPGAGDVQIARLEDAEAAPHELQVTPSQRHVSFTDLEGWLATALPDSPEPLARYTRGNLLTPYVNGGEYYDDLFRRIQDAREAGAQGGLHVVGGWQTFPTAELTRRREGDPADLPLTLEQAARALGEAGGATRVLSPQFIQLDPGSTIEVAELTVFSAIIMGLLRAQNVDFARTDAGGALILLALFVINAIAVTWIIDTDGAAIEPNRDAVDVLSVLPNTTSNLSPLPATVEDNPRCPPLSDFPFDQIFQLIRHFGAYHQKFVVLKAGSQRYGYCGGIDINPNRLDDIRHLARGPYHDVQARVQGPAVRDLELSFKERWSRDGGGVPLAYEPAQTSQLGTPGRDVVQVARTYFKAASPSRALAFAPNGDDTIARTMKAAIARAREFVYIEDQYFTPPDDYQAVLLGKVERREIHTLVIVLPSVTDQAFGEIVRSAFITALRDADAGAGIVRIGYPRRHYTVADNELRGSSGRLLLMQDLASSGGVDSTVTLGPKTRLPQPPFWLAIEGELMYAFNESTTPTPDPQHSRVFEVARGAETRLIKGGPVATAIGSRPRGHKKGAAVTVVDLAGIYVHAKMMIVDDSFVGIGSANLDRRGLYHDGEINVFSVPERLKAARDNPIAALRRRLWAEMLDLPIAAAGPLLEDPLAAARLFDRSPLHGNRFTDIDAFPTHLMFDATSGDGLVMDLLRLVLVDDIVGFDHQKLYDAVIDPTSTLEPI